MIHAALSGFAVSISLILAIGAQNAFVLRQGLRGQHVLPVVLTCALSDAVLISAGVAGLSAATDAVPKLAAAMRVAAAVVLLAYGALNFRAAWRGGTALRAADDNSASLSRVLAMCLALTWLNPHVYLDTVLLIGSVSAGFEGARGAFAVGAVAASFLFFFALGYGAALLRPVFARPVAWRVLDAATGALMWGIAWAVISG